MIRPGPGTRIWLACGFTSMSRGFDDRILTALGHRNGKRNQGVCAEGLPLSKGHRLRLDHVLDDRLHELSSGRLFCTTRASKFVLSCHFPSYLAQYGAGATHNQLH